MLTTGRGMVSANGDNYSVANPIFVDETNAQTNETFADTANTAAGEYSLDEIAKKIFGGDTKFSKESADLESDVDIENAGVAPSTRTMSCAGNCVTKANLYQDGTNVAVSTKSKTNTQIKIAVLSFAFLVLVLGVLVAVIGSNVANGYGAVSQLTAAQTAQEEAAALLAEQLGQVDDVAMLRMAQEAGYSVAGEGNTVYYSEPAMRSEQTFSIESNWFDRLCDMISGAFSAN